MLEYVWTAGRSSSGGGLFNSVPDIFVWALLGGGGLLLLFSLIRRRHSSSVFALAGFLLALIGFALGRGNGLLYW